MQKEVRTHFRKLEKRSLLWVSLPTGAHTRCRFSSATLDPISRVLCAAQLLLLLDSFTRRCLLASAYSERRLRMRL